MLNLPIVAAGEYDSDRIIAVFQNEADAQVFADKFNAERGYGINDGERARVESLPAFGAGDPGVSGHEVRVEWHTGRMGSGWGWTCTCGQHESWLTEQAAREQAARHITHWMGSVEQPALAH